MNMAGKAKIGILRKQSGLTQQALANAAGISIVQVQKLEYGITKIENTTLKNALALAKALGVRPEELM